MEKNVTLDLVVAKKSFFNDYAIQVFYYDLSLEYENKKFKLNCKQFEKNLLKMFLDIEFKDEETEKIYELNVVPKKILVKEVESLYAYEVNVNKRTFTLLPQVDDVLVLNWLIQQEFLPL